MTSWRRFLFHAAPWRWRVVLGLTFPLWARSVARVWEMAGGWAQAFGDRRTVGVKPARLLRRAQGELGRRLFLDVPDDDEKLRHVTCHELTHAFTAHLRLPAWLNEGLAMVAVDRLAGRPTVHDESRALYAEDAAPPSGRSLRRLGPEAIVALYARGYWTTRYLDEQHPSLLRDLLARRLAPDELEARLAAGLDAERGSPWPTIDARVAAHYAPGA